MNGCIGMAEALIEGTLFEHRIDDTHFANNYTQRYLLISDAEFSLRFRGGSCRNYVKLVRETTSKRLFAEQKRPKFPDANENQ
jgi:hypothetical protein